MNYTILIKLLMFTFLVSNIACGGKGVQWVQDAEIESYQMDGELVGELTTFLDTGGMILPSVQVPIINPKNRSEELGYLVMKPGFGSNLAELTIMLNISQAIGLNGNGLAVLPNGTPLPIAGVDHSQIMTFDLGGKHNIKVYATIDTRNEQAMMGVAVPIKQFQSIGDRLAGVNVFPGFILDNGVQGTFGLFTGKDEGQNGFALFADVSSLIKGNSLSGGQGLNLASKQGLKTESSPIVLAAPIKYLDVQTSSRNEKTIAKKLFPMMYRGEKLKLD